MDTTVRSSERGRHAGSRADGRPGARQTATRNHSPGHDPDHGPGRTTYAGPRSLGLLLLVTGAAGLLAAWVITLDKFKLLEDPDFTPGCSLNPVVSCGNIMESDQAAVFGFPNPMLGLAAYGIVMAVGAAVVGRVAFPRWYWLGLNGGALFGVVFCSWLQFQSLYRINALCLWCSLAWVATIIMFWYVTSFTVRAGLLPAPERLKSFLGEFTWVVPVLHTGVIGMLVLTRWWDFWTG